MPVFIEKRHEAPVVRRIADIRPFSERAAEWLSTPIHFAIAAITVALVPAFLAPLFLPLAVLVYAALAITYAVNRPLLPLRYPIFNKKLPPSGKKADGILMLGNVRSSSEYEHFKEAWLSSDDLRKHCLIIGATGSGKSETLKGILFNALCWSSGYFVADGKADNKMPTDNFTMVRSVGRDDDILVLNFLLGGRSPEQVAGSRRRRSNGTNPFSSADADTIIQMGANLLPKAEGDGKAWQEKALNFWRAVVVALCYKRDTQGMEISIRTFIDYMALPKVEELYIEGYLEAQSRGGQEYWSYGFAAIKTYLDSGCPAYKIDKLIARIRQDGGIRRPEGQPPNKAFDQESMAFEQHSYRTTQLMPVLNLLDKTYGHIFRDKFSEIDMVDVTLNNRILLMLIPSLEKSAQEAENLGKLAIACLRVMMGKNLGADIEGGRRELIESKATNAPYPYIVALDELAYYFSDGIAVMCAQARSLGFSMMALCQDLEKLTEGNRAAEAGAMMANQVSKYFMRIDDPKKTWELVQSIVGKAVVPVYRNFTKGALGWSREMEIDLQEVDRVDLRELQGMSAGQGVLNSCGETLRMSSFYMGDDLEVNSVERYHVNRFVQVRSPTIEEIMSVGTALDQLADPLAVGERRLKIMRYQTHADHDVAPDEVIEAMASLAGRMAAAVSPVERGIALYMAARTAYLARKSAIEAQQPLPPVDRQDPQDGGAGFSGTSDEDDLPEAPRLRAPTFPIVKPLGRAAAGGGSRQASDADEDNPNPLDFLNTVAPFKRKPVQELIPTSADPSFDADIQARMDNFASATNDPVARIIFGGRSMTLGQGEGPARVLDPSPTPSDVLHEQLSASTPFRSVAAGDGDWMVHAIDRSGEMLNEVASINNDVVGFTSETTQNVQRIEAALENPSPEAAAKALERVVATRITPPETIDDSGAIADIDDVNAVFEAIENGSLD